MNSQEVKFFKLDYDSLINELKEYARRAIGKGALSVILIGSLARGDYTAFSDADIIIIVGETEERPLDRIAKFMETRTSTDIDIRVYTWKEIEEMMERGSRIIYEIAEHGVLLEGDPKTIDEIRQRIKRK